MNNKKNKENTKPTNEASKLMNSTVPRNSKFGHNALAISKPNKKEGGVGNSVKTHGTLVKQQQQQQHQEEESKRRPAGQPSKANRQTLSQVFLSEQAVLQKKLVAEVAKPLVTAPPKPALGTYKGQVVQAKVNSFRKPLNGNDETGTKVAQRPCTAKVDTLKPGNPTRPRAMAAAAVPSRLNTAKASSALPPRPKSVSHKPLPPTVSKPIVSKIQQPAKLTANAPAKTVSSNAPGKGNEKEPLFNGKPRPPVVALTKKKTEQPSVTSKKSQYRVTMETAEERRAKLAEWLAAKGKTLKRPPISSAPPIASRPTCKTHAKSVPEPQFVVGQPEANLKPVVEPGFDSVPEPKTVPAPVSDLMNTTLDLLDNSEMDLPEDPEVRMDDLVVNLCNAMEAMEVPSTSERTGCESEGNKGTSKVTVEMKDEAEGLEVQVNGAKEDEGGLVKGSISARKRVKIKLEEECIGVERDTEEVGTPVSEASVVRYNVKSTPYLQSVGKMILEEAAPGSTGRRQSTIKELKFLTPVRRSCRIQRQSTRLPAMLADHDPCVASLAELAQLDSTDTNAYVYRRNPALLDSLPDQPGETEL